ncbi:hypothetical protein ACS6VG_002652 [Raoultella planticola]
MEYEILKKYQAGKNKNKRELFFRSALRITNIMAVFYQSLSLITKKPSGKHEGAATARESATCAAAEDKKGPHARAFF